MPRIVRRIVAVLLAACLSADPALDAGFNTSLSLGRGCRARGADSSAPFIQEAFASRALDVRRILTGSPASRIDFIEALKRSSLAWLLPSRSQWISAAVLLVAYAIHSRLFEGLVSLAMVLPPESATAPAPRIAVVLSAGEMDVAEALKQGLTLDSFAGPASRVYVVAPKSLQDPEHGVELIEEPFERWTASSLRGQVDAIYFFFPDHLLFHAGIEAYRENAGIHATNFQDATKDEQKQLQQLLRAFMRKAGALLKPNNGKFIIVTEEPETRRAFAELLPEESFAIVNEENYAGREIEEHLPLIRSSFDYEHVVLPNKPNGPITLIQAATKPDFVAPSEPVQSEPVSSVNAVRELRQRNLSRLWEALDKVGEIVRPGGVRRFFVDLARLDIGTELPRLDLGGKDGEADLQRIDPIRQLLESIVRNLVKTEANFTVMNQEASVTIVAEKEYADPVVGEERNPSQNPLSAGTQSRTSVQPQAFWFSAPLTWRQQFIMDLLRSGFWSRHLDQLRGVFQLAASSPAPVFFRKELLNENELMALLSFVQPAFLGFNFQNSQAVDSRAQAIWSAHKLDAAGIERVSAAANELCAYLNFPSLTPAYLISLGITECAANNIFTARRNGIHFVFPSNVNSQFGNTNSAQKTTAALFWRRLINNFYGAAAHALAAPAAPKKGSRKTSLMAFHTRNPWTSDFGEEPGSLNDRFISFGRSPAHGGLESWVGPFMANPSGGGGSSESELSSPAWAGEAPSAPSHNIPSGLSGSLLADRILATGEQPYVAKDLRRLDLPEEISPNQVNLAHAIQRALTAIWPMEAKDGLRHPEWTDPSQIAMEIVGSASYLFGPDGRPHWVSMKFHGENIYEIDLILHVPDAWYSMMRAAFNQQEEPFEQTLGAAITKEIGSTCAFQVDVAIMPVERTHSGLTEYPFHPSNWYFGSETVLRKLLESTNSHNAETDAANLNNYLEAYTKAQTFFGANHPYSDLKAAKRLVQMARKRGDEAEASRLLPLVDRFINGAAERTDYADSREMLKRGIDQARPDFVPSDIPSLVARYRTAKQALGPLLSEPSNIFRQKRLAMSQSVRSIASRVGISISMLTQIEGGRRKPGRTVAAELGKQLGLTPAELEPYVFPGDRRASRRDADDLTYLIELGKRLQAIRKERRISRLRLAQGIKIHPDHLMEAERGDTELTLKTYAAVSSALKTSLADLLDTSKETSAPYSPDVQILRRISRWLSHQLDQQGNRLKYPRNAADTTMRSDSVRRALANLETTGGMLPTTLRRISKLLGLSISQAVTPPSLTPSAPAVSVDENRNRLFLIGAGGAGVSHWMGWALLGGVALFQVARWAWRRYAASRTATGLVIHQAQHAEQAAA